MKTLLFVLTLIFCNYSVSHAQNSWTKINTLHPGLPCVDICNISDTLYTLNINGIFKKNIKDSVWAKLNYENNFNDTFSTILKSFNNELFLLNNNEIFSKKQNENIFKKLVLPIKKPFKNYSIKNFYFKNNSIILICGNLLFDKYYVNILDSNFENKKTKTIYSETLDERSNEALFFSYLLANSGETHITNVGDKFYFTLGNIYSIQDTIVNKLPSINSNGVNDYFYDISNVNNQIVVIMENKTNSTIGKTALFSYNGVNWVQTGNGMVGLLEYPISLVKLQNSTLYCITLYNNFDNKLYSTIDGINYAAQNELSFSVPDIFSNINYKNSTYFSTSSGVHRSDSLFSFLEFNNNGLANFNSSFFTSSANNIIAPVFGIRYSKNNTDYASEGRLFVSKDDAKSWTISTQNFPVKAPFFKLFSQGDSPYIRFDITVENSIDNGQTWANMNCANCLGNVKSISVLSNNTIFFHNEENKNYVSTNGGASFTELAFPNTYPFDEFGVSSFDNRVVGSNLEYMYSKNGLKLYYYNTKWIEILNGIDIGKEFASKYWYTNNSFYVQLTRFDNNTSRLTRLDRDTLKNVSELKNKQIMLLQEKNKIFYSKFINNKAYYSIDSAKSWILLDKSIENDKISNIAFTDSFIYASLANNGIVQMKLIKYEEAILNQKNSVFSSSLKIYPNPATSTLSLSISQNGTVTITNILGQEVLNVAFTVGQALDIEALTQGTYVLRLRSSNGVYVGRFVK